MDAKEQATIDFSRTTKPGRLTGGQTARVALRVESEIAEGAVVRALLLGGATIEVELG